jgi:hypothetical protein
MVGRQIAGILAVSWALALAGCDSKKASGSTGPAGSAVELAPSVGASDKAAKFVVDPTSTTSIDMPAPSEHIKADTSVAAGTIDVDPTNLASTRGQVKIDLTSLKTHTFGNEKDATQTEHALTWLEVAGPELTPDQIEGSRWAVFAIRSVDDLSATDLSKVAPTKDGTDDVRTVTLAAHGDFLLHGHKVPKDASLEVKLHSPAGASPEAKPTRIDILSKVPFRVVLADHDVKPRDAEGKLAQRAFNLLGTKVAETADVSLQIHATPAQ